MIYMYSLSAPYGYINALADKITHPIDFNVFSDIMINYMNVAISRWYGYSYADRNEHMFRVGLNMFLSEEPMEMYIGYLETQFWPSVSRPLPEQIDSNQVATVMIESKDTLIVEISYPEGKALTPMERTLLKVCQIVEDKIYAGEWVDPLLLEIYETRKQHHT